MIFALYGEKVTKLFLSFAPCGGAVTPVKRFRTLRSAGVPLPAGNGRRTAAKGGCACFEGPFLRKKGPSPKKHLGRAGSAFRPPRSASLPKNPPHRAPLLLFAVRSSYSTSYSTLLHQFVAAQACDSKLPNSPTQEQKKLQLFFSARKLSALDHSWLNTT